MPDDRALLHRYHADPRWRILVDSLLDRLVCESYSPTDVREAAQCAIVKYLGPEPPQDDARSRMLEFLASRRSIP